jgi:hypothetical protein
MADPLEHLENPDLQDLLVTQEVLLAHKESKDRLDLQEILVSLARTVKQDWLESQDFKELLLPMFQTILKVLTQVNSHI